MKNPFQYGGVVGGAAFCNRKKELRDLARAMENCEKLFVYSERRLGKTSLIQAALGALSKRQYSTAYVDLWPTEGELSFIATTAKALAESVSTTGDQLLRTAKQFFGRLAPVVTTDADGRPRITFGIHTMSRPEPELEEVLAAPAKLAARAKRKVAVVFDEVQQILEYDSDIVERRLRSVIQRHDAVSYIFLGSRKHLVQKMFLDRSRPLYRSAGHYPLGPIETPDWLPFIRQRFLDAGKPIGDDHVRALCQLTEGHPFYTQHLCHALWELAEPGAEVHGDLVKDAMRVLLDRESYAYTALWDSLTANQRKLLKGLAVEERGVRPFAAAFVHGYGLGSASSCQQAAKALLARDLIDRDNGSFVIVDRFFRIWVQKTQIV